MARDFVQECLQSGLRLELVQLFGSAARNQMHEDSDIDLLLISDQFGDNLFENLDLYARINSQYPRIETHPYSSKQYHEGNDFIQHIQNESIPIYQKPMKARIHYFTLTDDQRKEEKLRWFQESTLQNTPFRLIQPSKKNNWINLADNDFEELLPLVDKKVKAGKSEEAVFKLFSRGIETGRDDWVYDLSKEALSEKIHFFVEKYQESVKSGKPNYDIKWTSSLKSSFEAGKTITFSPDKFVQCLYRPFFRLHYYSESLLGHRLTKNHFEIKGDSLTNENIILALNSLGNSKGMFSLVSYDLIDLHATGDSQCLPLYRYDSDGNRVENITDWGLRQFREHYSGSGEQGSGNGGLGARSNQNPETESQTSETQKKEQLLTENITNTDPSTQTPETKSHEQSNELSGFGGVEGSHATGGDGVRGDKDVSEGGTLRTHQSGAAGGGFDSLEHSGGTTTPESEGVHSVPEHQQGVAGGSGDATYDRLQAGLPPEGKLPTADTKLPDNRTASERSDTRPTEVNPTPVPSPQNPDPSPQITKKDIFHYVYAVLHNPAYRKKYELNLKREFPRVPFYEDFWQWAAWGKQLMDLHLNYETAEPYPLERIEKELKPGKENKPRLKPDREKGIIYLDQVTELHGIPAAAWDYKLGNRAALDWILDQYKEKKIRDKTVREQFNTYRFADYKEQMIELLQRVCRVSVETVNIVNEMGDGDD